MLTYKDCVELSDLTEEEIGGIAMHEHLPDIVALEMGNYLLHDPQGIPMIKGILLDDIEEHRLHGRADKVVLLKLVLKHFVQTHPMHRASA